MVEEIIDDIFNQSTAGLALAKRKLALQQLPDDSFVELIEEIAQRLAAMEPEEISWRHFETMLPVLYVRPIPMGELSARLIAAIRTLYDTAPATLNFRNLCLAWLARMGNSASWMVWVDLLVQSPPEFRTGIHLAFAPLLSRQELPQELFERLLVEGMAHPQVAGSALDLMNYQTRQAIRDEHPAASRAAELNRLLGSLVDRLERIEEGLAEPSQDVVRIQQAIADSVAMIVSLCDALALIGYRAAEGKLLRATELRHRRVQTEAAAALARLGFDSGKTKLIALAAEPTARLRVLAYADELEMLAEIPETHQSDLAMAESRLANWLAEPQQMGLAPSSMTLLDCREFYWPGYEHPVLCYLFQYRYGAPPSGYANIGIVGPLVHSFESDISWMSLDDIYAAFAGWHAVHDDIYEISLEECQRLYPNWIEALSHKLQDQGYDQVEPEFVGVFMESRFLVASASQHDTDGFVIAGDQVTNWFATSEHTPRIDAEWAYMVYRGRLILKTFNDSGNDPQAADDVLPET